MKDTRPEQVAAFIKGNRPRAFCDACIKDKVGLARPQQAQQITSALATAGTFRRESGICAACGSERLITRVI